MFGCCSWCYRRKYKSLNKQNYGNGYGASDNDSIKRDNGLKKFDNNDTKSSRTAQVYKKSNCRCDTEGPPVIGTCECGAWRTY